MILIDENVPKSVYTELKKRGYDVKHVLFIKRGLKDREIIDLANREGILTRISFIFQDS